MVVIESKANIDTSSAVRNVGELSDSLEVLEEKLRAARSSGNWGEAANISNQISKMQSNTSGTSSGLADSALNQSATRQLDMRLEVMTRVITDLTDQLKQSTEKGNHKDSLQISAALNNAEQERQRLQDEIRQRDQGATGAGEEDKGVRRLGVANYLTQGLGYAQQIAGIGYAHRIAMANGDYLGADVSALESGAGIAKGIGGSLLGAGLMLGPNPAGLVVGGLGGLLSVGGTIAGMVAGDERADMAEGQAYQRTLGATNALNKRFSNAGTNWQANAAMTNNLLADGTRLAQNTGLSRDDFLNLATQQAAYGARTSGEAMNQARQAAMWANATGTDVGLIQNFLGTARRYGDDSDVIGYASQARQAAGLTKAQNQEFLTSLQSVIEDGIANGYIKSTEDVSKTFVMFSRLSNNNPLWQGENAQRRLSQMNSGLAGATGLQNVSDVVAAQAVNGLSEEQKKNLLGEDRYTGTYLDTMMLLEKGTDPTVFAAIAKNVQDLEGDNFAGQVERYKQIYGVNYSGAVDIAKMAGKLGTDGYTDADFARDVQEMQKDPNYQSEETKWQNSINEIDKNVALMAQPKFWESLARLQGEAGVGIGLGGSITGTSTGSTDVAEDYREGRRAALNKSIIDGDALTGLKTVLNDEDFAHTYNVSKSRNSTLNRLTSSEHGNEERDEIIMKNLAIYTAGSAVPNKEKAVAEFINSFGDWFGEGAKVRKAYERDGAGSDDAFLVALEALLIKVFGNIGVSVTE